MKLPIWQVDAFSARVFGGNPAAVVLLDEWPEDVLLRSIAAENNLAETAYLVREPEGWRIRWFTPMAEVPLCGHVTLAAGSVLLEEVEPGEAVTFSSESGPLRVEREGDRWVLDFPRNEVRRATTDPGVAAALGAEPVELWEGFQWLAVFEDEAAVRALQPDMAALVATGVHGVIATAPGRDCDFVSRFFAPAVGVPEDPVTGSAHTRLTPYWAERLGKSEFFARQVSARGGELWCELRGERVRIAGKARRYLRGEIDVPAAGSDFA